MFNKKILLFVGLVLFNNVINTTQGSLTIECDPRNVNHPTPQQWYLYSFKKLKYPDEKKVVINFLHAIVKKFELSKEIVNEQIILIEQGSDIQSAFQIIVETTSFNIPFPSRFKHLAPIIMDLIKTIMPITSDDFPDDSIDPQDKEKVILFINKYAFPFTNIILEKSNQCLFYIEKGEIED